MKRSHIVLGSVSALLLALGASAIGCSSAGVDARLDAPALTPEAAQSVSFVTAAATESAGTVTLSALVTVGNGAAYTLTGTVTASGHDIALSDGAGNTFHDATSANLQEIRSSDAEYNHVLSTSGDITETLDATPTTLADALAAAQVGAFGDQPLVGTELTVLANPATVAGLSPEGKALVATALARVSSAVVTFAGPAPTYPSGDAALPPAPAPAIANAACTATATTTASAPPVSPQALPCARTCNLTDAKTASVGAISLDLGNGLKVSGNGPIARHAATFWNDAKFPLISAKQGFVHGSPAAGKCRCSSVGVVGSGDCAYSRDSFTAYAYTDSSSDVCAKGETLPDKASTFDLSVTAPGVTVSLNDSCTDNLAVRAHAYEQATVTGCFSNSAKKYQWVNVTALTKKTVCA